MGRMVQAACEPRRAHYVAEEMPSSAAISSLSFAITASSSPCVGGLLTARLSSETEFSRIEYHRFPLSLNLRKWTKKHLPKTPVQVFHPRS